MKLLKRLKGAITLATKRWVEAIRRLVDRALGKRRTRRCPAHDHHKDETKRLGKRQCFAIRDPGYQTRSLFFSDGETIKPRPKAHKPADSGAVVGSGARICSLSEYLEMSFKHRP
ncbi:hypothetical protein C1X69_29270 [Pseudomonas sp. FW305-67]|nr:hypothetical protein C1X70_28615 [Pseudomonas sp. FW305-53]PMY85616.1 hypothetical protein C1X68_18790 [Pseudomonas sp. FW303-C2]PMY89362.1 hypothetical protein C1X67_29395 [Pseudomonas sp. FW305-62]PNA45732.1 hypothetical protein C1X71_03305 [Pseudomonas sp. FW306-2-2C-A10BC]PNA88552.1 hypothetical protein C1X66_03860 [Pseudomonas sp. MPR-R3B]PNB10203.1 hypothetical protein C1X69_29270 [Pseudomonas sp. FW305-67]